MVRDREQKAKSEMLRKSVQNNPEKLRPIPSDISVSVNTEDGQQKEYTYSDTLLEKRQ